MRPEIFAYLEDSEKMIQWGLDNNCPINPAEVYHSDIIEACKHISDLEGVLQYVLSMVNEIVEDSDSTRAMAIKARDMLKELSTQDGKE